MDKCYWDTGTHTLWSWKSFLNLDDGRSNCQRNDIPNTVTWRSSKTPSRPRSSIYLKNKRMGTFQSMGNDNITHMGREVTRNELSRA